VPAAEIQDQVVTLTPGAVSLSGLDYYLIYWEPVLDYRRAPMKSDMRHRRDRVRINSSEEYRRALERCDELRDRGEKAHSNPELAALEGAIAEYDAPDDVPEVSKGKPIANPAGRRHTDK
jgi:hypothetical protein